MDKYKKIQKLHDLVDELEINFTAVNFSKVEHRKIAMRIYHHVISEMFNVNDIDYLEIRQIFCNEGGISLKDLMSKSREEKITRVRHAICYFFFKEYKMSLNEIGDMLGITHSSVKYACRIVSEQYMRFAPLINEVKYKLI